MGCATLRIAGAQAADAACGVRGEVSHCMESASYMDRIMYSLEDGTHLGVNRREGEPEWQRK